MELRSLDFNTWYFITTFILKEEKDGYGYSSGKESKAT